MLDMKLIRENPELVKQNIRNKFQEQKLPLVDEIIELDAKARKTQQEADALRAGRNKLSKQIGALMKEGKKEGAAAVKAQVEADAKRLEELEALEKEPAESHKQIKMAMITAIISTVVGAVIGALIMIL